MLTGDQIQALLQGLPGRATRSGVEPYRDLVLEMRRRTYSYRDISPCLAAQCGFEISRSAIHDFVTKHSGKPVAVAGGSPGAAVPQVSREPLSHTRTAEDTAAIHERIAAMKSRKGDSSAAEAGFRFDLAQPLHLKGSAE